nr:HCO3- transporter family [Tanacetum cinerariifolium]
FGRIKGFEGRVFALECKSTEMDNDICVNDEGDVSICDAEILDELTTTRLSASRVKDRTEASIPKEDATMMTKSVRRLRKDGTKRRVSKTNKININPEGHPGEN